MDIHNLDEGTTAEDVGKAHAKDMEVQQKYGVKFSAYWVNESGKKLSVSLTRRMPKRQNESTVKPTE
jgi:hypothetical protein